MSHIDLNNNHSVVEYVAGVTKPLSNQRLSVLFWKTDKETGVKKDSKCVSIDYLKPENLTPAYLEFLTPHILDMLASVQNKIIREAVENGASTILGVDISVAACIEYLNAESLDGNSGTSQRLTSEYLAQWYDEVLDASVLLAVSDKLGIGEEPTGEQSAKVEAIGKKYKETICKLSSGSFKLPPDYAALVKKVIGFAPAGDNIAAKLVARLDKMTVKQEDLLVAL